MIKSPPCNAGAIGLMPGQGTMIPHAKRQLSLHGTARERLHAPSGRAHTSNQESRRQEEPTHYKGDPTQPRTKLFLSTEISIKTHKVQAVGFRFTVGFSEDSPVRQPLRWLRNSSRGVTGLGWGKYTDELIYKTETDSQPSRKNWWLLWGGEGRGIGDLGLTGTHCCI